VTWLYGLLIRKTGNPSSIFVDRSTFVALYADYEVVGKVFESDVPELPIRLFPDFFHRRPLWS
jgi:hypothetical protein